jgi:ketosteroid isomerase-like protein
MTALKDKISIKEQVTKHLQAVNGHDLESFAASFREDATVYDPMYPEPLKGRAAIRRDMEEFMTAFPDLQGSLGWFIESGDLVAMK